MITLRRLLRSEKGQALPIVLVLLLLGSLMVVPLLEYLGNGLKAGQVHEDRTAELYAGDAGVEDAAHKIINSYAPLQTLGDDDFYTYSLSDPVNNVSVNVTITKLSILEGTDEDYKEGQPHEDWLDLETPVVVTENTTYVEYSCSISANYTGGGNRRVESMGVYYAPHPGAGIQVDLPFDVVFTGALATGELEATSPEYSTPLGGFAFIWRWKKNQEATFDGGNPVGTASFKFRVHDPAWRADYWVAWFTVREQDVSYIDSGTLNKWRIEALAEDTLVTANIYQQPVGLFIATWDINLQ